MQREILKKKGPSLDDMSKHELVYELFQLTTGSSQSSGADHQIMEHNQRAIEKKGMTYHPDDMALYIYSNYNINRDKSTLVSSEVNIYSISEIYKKSCLACHGAAGEGNPEKKGPAINDMTRSELEMELFNLQSDGFQSSGASNEIMEHNQRRIEDRDLEYHPEDMAIYIYFNFNPDAKK